MRFHYTFPLFFLVATIGCAFAQTSKPVAERVAAQNAIFEEQYETDLRNFPERATAFGDYRYNDELAEYSLEAIAHRHKTDEEFVARLDAIPTTGFSDQDQLSHDLMIRVLGQRIADFNLKEYEMPINQQNGVHTGLADLPLTAEPGRVIVARSLSVIVRVLLRKGRRIYINDGIWASLSDSWTGKITLPARLLPDPAHRGKRPGNPDTLMPFRVCGATCDSVDILSRPFYLPETVDTGDWIEIGHIGAYSLALRTHFNGFYPDTFVEVTTPFEAAGPAESLATIETMAAE